MRFPIVNPVFTLLNGHKTVFWCISRLLIFELNQTATHFALFGVQGNPNYQFANIVWQGEFGSLAVSSIHKIRNLRYLRNYYVIIISVVIYDAYEYSRINANRTATIFNSRKSLYFRYLLRYENRFWHMQEWRYLVQFVAGVTQIFVIVTLSLCN